MANTVTLEFAGDAKRLADASKQARSDVTAFGADVTRASRQMDDAAASNQDYTDRVGRLGAAVSGATDAFDSIGGAMQAAADIADYSRARADRLARAELDVEQASIDAKQATVDLKQSRIDLRQATEDLRQSGLDEKQALLDQQQATLDAKTAQDEYNKAVKEHGRGSDEAKQASIDLKQANLDLEQANADVRQSAIDAEQAEADMAQARVDGRQATADATEATLNFNSAMHEANPPDLSVWAERIGMVTPLLSALVGVVGLVTAAQWAWNAAQAASPMTWVILAIGLIVGGIVLLATKTEWGRQKWSEAWNGIKGAASAVGRWFRDTLWGSWIKGAWDSIKNKSESVWNWLKALPGKIKNEFAKVKDHILQPFRSAFNNVAYAWNSTVGALSWTVPAWVPGVGGNTIAVPNMPTFHQGGTVPGVPGAEVLIRARAGETVSTQATAARAANGSTTYVLRGDAVIDALIDTIARRVGHKGGHPATLGITVSR